MIRINKEVYWRFEPNFKSPKLIIYFINQNKLYELTPPYYYYLRLVEKNSLEEMLELIKLSDSNLLSDISLIKNNLMQLGVIYEGE